MYADIYTLVMSVRISKMLKVSFFRIEIRCSLYIQITKWKFTLIWVIFWLNFDTHLKPSDYEECMNIGYVYAMSILLYKPITKRPDLDEPRLNSYWCFFTKAAEIELMVLLGCQYQCLPFFPDKYIRSITHTVILTSWGQRSYRDSRWWFRWDVSNCTVDPL